MKFVTFCKNWKSVKWYGGMVQNSGTITQILAGLCIFNYVKFRAVFHSLIQKCLGGLIFSEHTVHFLIFKLLLRSRLQMVKNNNRDKEVCYCKQIARQHSSGCPLFFNIDFPWLFHDQKNENPWPIGTTHISKQTIYDLWMHTRISSDSSS